MAKVAVVYWTLTGNTEQMAQAIAEGTGDAEVFQVSDFPVDGMDRFDAFAFGCPAMGAEELDHDEFEPVWDASVPRFGQKPVALFGSYDWGTGDWMDSWKSAAEEAGVNVVDALIINLTPDDEGVEKCRALGAKLAE